MRRSLAWDTAFFTSAGTCSGRTRVQVEGSQLQNRL